MKIKKEKHIVLPKINTPADMKKVDPQEYERLAAEIRGFLLENLSSTGGHLASNLGVVELTMALHTVFDSPKDKIIWDVGHQSYIHKLMTNRKDKFNTLRKKDGISGFPSIFESPFDAFGTGHSSTSISAGLGIAKARDIKKENFYVVSVIGDGALTSGMAYEALNNLGFMQVPMIIVLNDNEMSISENVGGFSQYLNNIRYTHNYLEAKKEVKGILSHMPIIGTPVHNLIEKMKDSAYQLLVPDDFFKALNIKYYGPVDGHDTNKIIEALENIKDLHEPVVLHVKTTKGKGYPPAEKIPNKFHGVDSFHVYNGKSKTNGKVKSYSDVFGETLVELAKKDERLIAITAAMPDGTGLSEFSKLFPDRFIDVGIAESHGVTLAGGLAVEGMKPVFAVYSTFLQRAYDQLIHDIAIQKLPIILGIDRAGFVGGDGETHHGVFDISMLLSVPGIEILAPRDGNELKQMLALSLTQDIPIGIRYGRGSSSGVKEYPSTKVVWGAGEVLEEGEEIAIVSVGSMLKEAVEVRELLMDDGYNPKLIHMGFLKQLEWLKKEIHNIHHIITLEENVLSGGFGSYMATHFRGKQIYAYGIKDEFLPHASREELLDMAGLTSPKIYADFIYTYEKTKQDGTKQERIK